MLRSKNYGGDTNNCSLAAGNVSAGKKPKVKMFHSNMEGKTKIDAYQSKMFLPLLLFIVLTMASTRTAEAQFSPNNFHVVDNTKKNYLQDVNGNYTGSYKHYTGTNKYRLTGEERFQSVAMWYETRLDLTKDFIVDMKLYFAQKINGADGIAFVMHTKSNTSTLIGDNNAFLGYGRGSSTNHFGVGLTHPSTISPSFAIEFDTEYSDDFGSGSGFEGGNEKACHTSYLQNASMTALSGTYSPMQNNWRDVRSSQWICVRIKWVRTNGINGNDGYDLITYVQEKQDLASIDEMIQRSSKHFNTLSELISGLTASNPFVTWGITSATCSAPNIHEVEYVNILNADLSKDMLITMSGSSQSVEWFTSDTIYQSPLIMPSPCSPMSSNNTPVNIVTSQCSWVEEYWLGVDEGINTSDAKWYIMVDGTYQEKVAARGKNKLVLSDYKADFEGQDHVMVKLEINGKTYLIRVNLKGEEERLRK